jgi:hypothetical protein
MSTENFDSASPPAFPSGWGSASNCITIAGSGGGAGSAYSSPNCVSADSSGSNGFVTADAQDTNGGDITLTAVIHNSPAAPEHRGGVIARASLRDMTDDYYMAVVYNATVDLWKLVNGSFSVLGSVTGITGFTEGFYKLIFTLSGTSLAVAVQQLSSSNWVKSNATISAGQANCITATDSGVTGSGYYGIYSYYTTLHRGLVDNFEIDQGSPATSYTMTGPTSGAINAASTNFTLTPNGTTSVTITPASDGTGTFSPTSLTWTGDASAKTFTYTPTSIAGSPHTISATDNGSLTDPASIDYTVVAVPDDPYDLAAGTPTSSSIPLSWVHDTPENVVNFLIQYATENTFATPLELEVDPEDTSGSVGSLNAETEYFFRVRAENAEGNSDWALNVAETLQYVSATTAAEGGGSPVVTAAASGSNVAAWLVLGII